MQEKCNFVLIVIPEAKSWTHTHEQRAVFSAGMFEPPDTKNMVQVLKNYHENAERYGMLDIQEQHVFVRFSS